VVDVRRSARLQHSESQRADYVLLIIVASLLQNEMLQDAVRV